MACMPPAEGIRISLIPLLSTGCFFSFSCCPCQESPIPSATGFIATSVLAGESPFCALRVAPTQGERHSR